LTTVLIAGAASALPANASEPPALPLAVGEVVPAGPAIERPVSPNRRFRITIPKVGTLTGPRGAVSSRGTLVIRPYRASLSDGVSAAGLGVDVVLRGAKLKKRLTLTQRVRRAPEGTVPLVAHRAADGSWNLRRGHLVHGRQIRVVTKRFSINIPAWANPKEWARAIGDRFAATIGGRTSPWECPVAPPRWFSVNNGTSTVHACATSNNDAGGERGELRIKSNRGAVLQVTLAGPRDYAWVEGQPDRVRSLLGSVMGTDPGNVVFLSKGDDGMMSVGYRQPARTSEYSLLAETTYRSVILNLAYFIIDYAAGEVAQRVKFATAVYLLSKCSGVLDLSSGAARSPRDAVSGASFTSVLSCVINESANNLRDPLKATNVALGLNDPSLGKSEVKAYGEQLKKTADKLQGLGWALTLRPILQQGWQGIADTLAALFTDGASTRIDVTLDARQSTPAATPTPATPAPATPTPGGGGGGTPPPAERTLVIYNKVTNGASAMREDTPAYLSTTTRNFCKRDGCALGGTDMGSGAQIVAVCQTGGARTTNGQDNSAIDDGNPGLFESTRWYLMRWGDGRTGYLSEVWVEPGYRGGMGLRSC
jgi:hypothetical protein